MSNTEKLSLEDQAKIIMEIAERAGVQSNFLFRTTFERYLVQLSLLDGLKASITELGTTVTKEYVKGRQNLYSNPAVAEYNRTTDSANKTVSTLMRIIRTFNVGDDEEEEGDPIFRAINGDASL